MSARLAGGVGGRTPLITRDRAFHSSFWPFCITVVAQNLLVLSVNLLDNVMLGGYEEAALAGAAAINQVFFLLQQVVNGAGDGMMTLTSQYWGQKRGEPIQRITAVALWLSLGIGMVFFVLSGLIPGAVMRAFTADAAITRQGMDYLSVLRWTFPLFALSAILQAMLRSVETVRVGVYISVSALGINAVLNYALIYGNLGAPELGVRGAAIATLVARVVELLILVGFLAFRDDKLRVRPGLLLRPTAALTRDYFRVSVPTLVIGFQWGLNTALQTVILGQMTAVAIAANSIASTLVMLLKVAAAGTAAAAGVLIGKTVGQGALDKVREYTKSLQLIFVGVGVLTGAGILLLRGPMLGLYNISEETRLLAGQFMLVLSVTSVGMAYQMPALTGIVRGGGDTRFVMINDMVSVWLIVIPLALLAAFVWGWPPVAVVACLHSDQIFKCLPAVIKVNSYNWIKKLTRA